MAVVCLITKQSISTAERGNDRQAGRHGKSLAATYVKTALQLAISAQLDKDELVDQEADEVERLRDVCAVIAGVCHDLKIFRYWVVGLGLSETNE